MMSSQEVEHEVLHRIIEVRQPRGLFLAQEGSLWVAVDNSTGDAWTEGFPHKEDAEGWLHRRDHPYNRIDALKELDLPRLKMDDLRWKYGTGQAQSTGSGRDKRYTYRTGVGTPIGDIEIEVWIKAAEYMVEREGLQEEMEHLAPYMRFYNNGDSPKAKRDAYADLLSACISRLYCRPEWVCFAEYNQKYHPDMLTATRERAFADDHERYTFPVRPAEPDEEKLFFAMTPEEDAALGTIGHYRIDFGNGGSDFWFTWHRRGSVELITDELKHEVDTLIGELREGPLKNLRSMELYCRTHGSEIAGGARQSYGYVAESEHYRYYLRCIPFQGDYNAYLTCFRRLENTETSQ